MNDLEARLRAEREDHFVPDDRKDLDWLAEQLAAWPHRRVHPDKTMNDDFLRHSAAITMLVQADHIATQQAEILALRAQVERLKGALDPFAACCEYIADDEDDEEWAKFRLLIKDYRHARNALKEVRDAAA